MRTTYGSKIFAEHVPDHDSAVYEKLTEAGAVLMGKNGMHELAYGVTSDNPHFGTIRNPRNPGCIPGGSSEWLRRRSRFKSGVLLDWKRHRRINPCSGRVLRMCRTEAHFGARKQIWQAAIGFSLDHVGPLTRTNVPRRGSSYESRSQTVTGATIAALAAPSQIIFRKRDIPWARFSPRRSGKVLS